MIRLNINHQYSYHSNRAFEKTVFYMPQNETDLVSKKSFLSVNYSVKSIMSQRIQLDIYLLYIYSYLGEG